MTDHPYTAALSQTADKLSETESLASELRSTRLNLMWKARLDGLSYSQIAEAAGVTKAYVHQVVKAEAQRVAAEFKEASDGEE